MSTALRVRSASRVRVMAEECEHDVPKGETHCTKCGTQIYISEASEKQEARVRSEAGECGRQATGRVRGGRRGRDGV